MAKNPHLIFCTCFFFERLSIQCPYEDATISFLLHENGWVDEAHQIAFRHGGKVLGGRRERLCEARRGCDISIWC